MIWLEYSHLQLNKLTSLINEEILLCNSTPVVVVDKPSSTTVDFIRSEGELKNCTVYGF